MLGLLLLGTQMAIYILFHQYVMNPAAERLAEFLLQTDQALVHGGVSHVPGGNLQWQPASKEPGAIPHHFFWAKSAHYLQGMAPEASLRVDSKSGRVTRIWIRNSSEQPWLGILISPIDLNGQEFIFIRLGIIALVSLLGAWLIVKQINRPLARLATEAPRIGLGDTPESLKTIGGPLEVQNLTRAITSMANDLHRLHEERTVLLAGISHELRTPLSRLLLTLHLPDIEFVDQKSAMCLDVNEMDETIDKFLTLVRSGDQEKTISANVQEWLEKMLEIARERYELQIHIAETTMDVSNHFFQYRPLALERVFRILFDNASRYGGGIMQVQFVVLSDLTEIRLRDYGSGVTAATLHALNEGTLPHQSGHGAGIGIRICHHIMALHGGSLHFEHAADGGFVAILYFHATPII